MRVEANLTFEVTSPRRGPTRGTLRGSDNVLTLDVEDLAAFLDACGPMARPQLAETIAGAGVELRLTSQGVRVASIGAVDASWWQRRLTGSRRIRPGTLRGLWAAALARRSAGAPTDPLPLPPTTLWPLAPTMRRPAPRPKPQIAGTHDPARGGSARLVAAPGTGTWVGGGRSVCFLAEPLTSIGSHPSCDIVLQGLRDLHAEVVHDDDDEYILIARSDQVSVNGVRAPRLMLRTGCLLRLGAHTLSFVREEFADHGRPHGGRIGGEWGHQKSQPPR